MILEAGGDRRLVEGGDRRPDVGGDRRLRALLTGVGGR